MDKICDMGRRISAFILKYGDVQLSELKKTWKISVVKFYNANFY